RPRARRSHKPGSGSIRRGRQPWGASYFSDRMYFASVCASASLTVVFGGIGIWPQSPVEPSRIRFTRYASASLRARNFFATSLYAGPTTLLSRLWQARHALSRSSCCASCASAGAQTRAPAAVNQIRFLFMNSPWMCGTMLMDFDRLGNLRDQVLEPVDRRQAANAFADPGVDAIGRRLRQ